MSHEHILIDDQIGFEIDPVSREIICLYDDPLVISQGDHNSERFTFRLPKLVEGHDMTQTTTIYIHYVNTSSNGQLITNGTYEVNDILSTNDEDTGEEIAIFTWLVSGNATKHVGSLKFAIRFVCALGNGLEYAWATGVFSNVSIIETINNGDTVVQESYDVLTDWEKRLFSLKENEMRVSVVGNRLIIQNAEEATDGTLSSELMTGSFIVQKANMAVMDESGNNIENTYAKKTDIPTGNDESDTYAKKTDVENTYAKKVDVENTYAKKTDIPTIDLSGYVESDTYAGDMQNLRQEINSTYIPLSRLSDFVDIEDYQRDIYDFRNEVQNTYAKSSVLASYVNQYDFSNFKTDVTDGTIIAKKANMAVMDESGNNIADTYGKFGQGFSSLDTSVLAGGIYLFRVSIDDPDSLQETVNTYCICHFDGELPSTCMLYETHISDHSAWSETTDDAKIYKYQLYIDSAGAVTIRRSRMRLTPDGIYFQPNVRSNSFVASISYIKIMDLPVG